MGIKKPMPDNFGHSEEGLILNDRDEQHGMD